MFIRRNLNPSMKVVGDCVVRAIAEATDSYWDAVYMDLAIQGLLDRDMPSSNAVWMRYLEERGYKRFTLPNTCPVCYSIRDFAKDNPKGTFVLATGTHVVTVRNGDYIDTWDSGDEVPLFYFRKE